MSRGEGETVTTDEGDTFVLGQRLSYRGKIGCRDARCSTDGSPDRCYGWHCANCDRPSSMQGHYPTCPEPRS